MKKFEIVAEPAREAVRSALNELCEGTEIFSKRRDYYTYQNTHGFQFVFVTGLLFESQFGVGVAYFSPAIAFCHKELAKQLLELENKSYFSSGRPKERWKPPAYMHLQGMRGRKEQMFGEIAPLVKAAREEFSEFITLTEAFEKIEGPSGLLRYLKSNDSIFGPAGLVFEMFLEQLILDKAEFADKYKNVEFAPIHTQFYEAIMKNYNGVA